MVKFIKGLFKAGRDFKSNVMSTATSMTSMTIEQNYQMYFLAINAYIKGNPDSKARLVWHSLIENVVDDKSTCDDEGFVGMKIKERCKLIGKEKEISLASMFWVENELKPYFIKSLKEQKQDLSELMLKHIIDEDITSEEAKPFFDKHQREVKAKNYLMRGKRV